jgi:hypothetical protein
LTAAVAALSSPFDELPKLFWKYNQKSLISSPGAAHLLRDDLPGMVIAVMKRKGLSLFYVDRLEIVFPGSNREAVISRLTKMAFGHQDG